MFTLALLFGRLDLLSLFKVWGSSLWELNNFAMQMSFILLLGNMLATHQLFDLFFDKILKKISSEGLAIVLFSLLSLALCWLNWGMGLVLSGVVAVKLKRRFADISFGILVMTAYSGFLVWHGGLSGSIPLKIAGKSDVLESLGISHSFSLKETLFSSLNLSILLALFFFVPLTNYFFYKKMNQSDKLVHDYTFTRGNFRPGILTLIGCLLLVFLLGTFHQGVGINFIITLLLGLNFILLGSIQSFQDHFRRSLPLIGGILIQFPFYAGIMGLMKESGLVEVLSRGLIFLSQKEGFFPLTFLSGGLINFFVPSGGGQWVFQGPVIIKAAQQMGLSLSESAMVLAWGDAWSNMVQPFWAIPLLALSGLKVKDIMKFGLVHFLVSGGVILTILLLRSH